MAVGLRVAYHRQLSSTPEILQHQSGESDMGFFDSWAQVIAEGDLLTDQELHPLHGWHTDIARLWFSWHPEERALREAEAAARGDGSRPEAMLWNSWFGGKQLHQEPLYPYALGLLYALGGGAGSMLVLQLLVGVLSVLLIYRITGRAFGGAAAAAAALLATFYGPLLLYDLVLLRTTMLVAVGLWLVDRADLAFRRGTPGAWWVCGLVCGLAVLLKASFALFFLGLVAVLVLRERSVRHALVCSAACLLCLAPVFARNLAVGAPVFSLTSVGPIHFALNNSAGAQASLSGFVPNPHTMAEVFGQAGGEPGAVVQGALASLGSVGAFLELASARLSNTFHWYEIPNNVNFYVFREQAPALAWAGVSFAVLAPLGLIGLWLARRRRCGPALWLVLTSLIPLVALGILARYRVLFAAALLPFAGLALARGLAWVAARRWSWAGSALAGALAFGVALSRPLPEDVPLIREADLAAPWGFAVRAEVEAAEARGDPQAAVDALQAMLRRAPPELESLREDELTSTPREARLAFFYAPLQARLAKRLDELGDEAGARVARHHAQRLNGAVKVTWAMP